MTRFIPLVILMFRKKDGGISVVAKKRSAIGTFFDNHYKMVSNFLGLTQSTVGLLFMVVLVGMGERMAERFLPMYLLALGGGVISIGLLNGLDKLLSAVMPSLGDIYPSLSGLNDHCSFFKSVTRRVFWVSSKMRPAL